MDWFRWYHGTSSDPKWRVISKVSGVSIPIVLAIWQTLCESASANEEDRGTLSGWNAEDVAALLDVTDVTVVTVTAVTDAMQGRVLRGNKLISWEKRNPKRERQDDSSERVRRHREKQKQSVTPRNAMKRLDKRRVDKKRLEGKEEKTGEGAVAPQSLLSLGEFGNAKVTQDQHQKLITALGQKLDSYIARFDRWIEQLRDPKTGALPAKYRNRQAYLSILNWFETDTEKGDSNGTRQQNSGRNQGQPARPGGLPSLPYTPKQG